MNKDKRATGIALVSLGMAVVILGSGCSTSAPGTPHADTAEASLHGQSVKVSSPDSLEITDPTLDEPPKTQAHTVYLIGHLAPTPGGGDDGQGKHRIVITIKGENPLDTVTVTPATASGGEKKLKVKIDEHDLSRTGGKEHRLLVSGPHPITLTIEPGGK